MNTRPWTRRALLVALAGACVGAWAQVPQPPTEVASDVPGARLRGSGRLTFLGLHVYDARLWTGEDFTTDEFTRAPFALELEYARALYGKLIAQRSIEEMKRLPGMTEEQAQRWLATMLQAFPDVHKGDRITGVHRPGEARLFVNASLRGEVRESEFARRFFGIWLAPHTSQPKLRQALLGPAAARP